MGTIMEEALRGCPPGTSTAGPLRKHIARMLVFTYALVARGFYLGRLPGWKLRVPMDKEDLGPDDLALRRDVLAKKWVDGQAQASSCKSSFKQQEVDKCISRWLLWWRRCRTLGVTRGAEGVLPAPFLDLWWRGYSILLSAVFCAMGGPNYSTKSEQQGSQ